MIDLESIRRPQKTEAIGARITKQKKDALKKFLKDKELKNESALIELLLTDFLKQKGYL